MSKPKKHRRRALARRVHDLSSREKALIIRDVLPGAILLSGLTPMLPEGLGEGCKHYLSNLMEELQPRDPLERMFCEQLVLCHHRAADLSARAMTQISPQKARVLHELADRAMNTFRRGMLAFRDYRTPVRSSAMTVQQLNQAEQQNIMLAENVSMKKKRDKRTRGQSWRRSVKSGPIGPTENAGKV